MFQRSSTPRLVPLSVSLLTLALISCGSSGGGGGDDDDGGGGGGGGGSTSTGDRFHLLEGSLKVLDPADPDQVFTLEDQLPTTFEVITSGDVASGGGVLENIAFEKIVYGKGATVYEASLAIDRVGGVAQEPEVEEVLTLGSDVQELWVLTDFAASDPTYIYVVGTATGFETFTQVGGSVSAAVPFPGEVLTDLINPSNGAFEGWLALESGNLNRIEPDLTSSLVAPAQSAEDLGVTLDGDLFLQLDGQLYSYETDGTLNDLGASLAGLGIGASVVDEEIFFFRSVGALDFQIYRSDVDGPVEPVGTAQSGFPLGMAVTSTRVVVSYTDPIGGQNLLISMTHGGGGFETLDTNQNPMLLVIPNLAGEQVYYNTAGLNAYAVDSDGSDRIERMDAEWLLPQVSDELSLENRFVAETLFLSKRNGGAGIELCAVSPQDPGGTLLVLGDLDPKFAALFMAPHWTDTHLVTAVEVDAQQQTVQTDVFFFDSTDADSLIQVTDTPGDFETGLF